VFHWLINEPINIRNSISHQEDRRSTKMETRDASAMVTVMATVTATVTAMDAATSTTEGDQDADMTRAESLTLPPVAAYDEEAGESLCEKKFFDERAEVAALLQRLVDAQLAAPESEVDAEFLKDHEAVTQIVRVVLLSCCPAAAAAAAAAAAG
jgi:hypothetical protein